MPRKRKPHVFAWRIEHSKLKRKLKEMLALPVLEIDKLDEKTEWQRCYDRAKGNMIEFKSIDFEDVGFTGKIIGLFSPDQKPLAYKVETVRSGREETTVFKVDPQASAS